MQDMQEGAYPKKKKKSVAGQFAAVKNRSGTCSWTQKLNREDYGVDKHIRLSFGIVHSIITYSTISKIAVRPREIGTGGTGVTSNHDNEAHRGSDSVFYSLI